MTKADHFKIADDGTTQISHEYQAEQLLESIRASIARLTTLITSIWIFLLVWGIEKEAFSPPMLTAIAIGVLLYGIYTIIQAVREKLQFF
jgi:hypothetical protein